MTNGQSTQSRCFTLHSSARQSYFKDSAGVTSLFPTARETGETTTHSNVDAAEGKQFLC